MSWLVGRFVCQSHFHISTWCLWTVIKRPWTTEHNLFSEHYDQQVSDLDLQSVFFQNVFLVSVPSFMRNTHLLSFASLFKCNITRIWGASIIVVRILTAELTAPICHPAATHHTGFHMYIFDKYTSGNPSHCWGIFTFIWGKFSWRIVMTVQCGQHTWSSCQIWRCGLFSSFVCT